MRSLYKRQNRSRSRKGVSLAELLFAIGLMAFVATAAIGGMVVINRVKETIDKQAKANMIMMTTVGYLRTDLNSCKNPQTMDCTNPNNYPIDKNDAIYYYPVFYVMDPASGRYTKFKIKNADGSVTRDTTGVGATVQYYNTSMGICVGLKYDKDVPSVNGLKAPLKTRKYVIGQNIMEDTGMISRIGGNGKINYNEETKLFEFTVEVVDTTTNQVILSQDVKVCPDTLMPAATTNP